MVRYQGYGPRPHLQVQPFPHPRTPSTFQTYPYYPVAPSLSPSITTPKYTKQTNPLLVPPHRPPNRPPQLNDQHHNPSNKALQGRPLSPRPPRHAPQQDHSPRHRNRLVHEQPSRQRHPVVDTPARGPAARLARNPRRNEDGVPAAGIWDC